MTPTERAALLLKVQRALDAKKIGREEVHIYAGGLVGEGIVAVPRMDNSLEIQHHDTSIEEPIATFTFAELFPELEWFNGVAKVAVDPSDPEKGEYTFKETIWKGTIDLENFEGASCLLEFRTPERAKRAAQMLADLLAEAGRDLDQ
jgi:hypothetical protein